MEEHKGLPMLAFASQTKFRVWLRRHHKQQEGLWVMFAKKNSGVTTATYVEAREEAIAWGWIDGLKNAYDQTYYLLRFTPRRSRSKWSLINREIAQGLIERGGMRPSGLAQVEAAREDGRWERAYPSASKMTVHPALTEALTASPAARTAFEALDGANRYSVLFGVWDAATDATRARRVAKTIDMLERGETPHPPSQKASRAKTASNERKTTKKKT